MTYEDILTRFKVITRNGDKAQCKCPCHDDKQASLTISKGKKGVVIKCFAGCGTEDVIGSVGLTMSDLFYENSNDNANWKSYIEGREKKQIEATYNYVSINGDYCYSKVRLTGKGMIYGILKDNRFTYGLGGKSRKDHMALYGDIARVHKAIQDKRPIFVPEGEKDVDTLALKGYTAITYGGANDWQKGLANVFKGAIVYVLADNDISGMRVAQTIETDLKNIASYVKVIIPMPDTPKADVTDYFEQGHTKEQFEELLKQEKQEDTKNVKEERIESEDLSQFHIRNGNGVITSVFDFAIVEHIKAKHNLFFCGGLPYIYNSGVYVLDSSGARLKSMIKTLIYPQYIKSNTITRIYNLFLQDITIERGFEALNNYPNHWICFENGMYDCREKRLLPHDAKYLCINQVPHNYNPTVRHTGIQTEKYLRFICEEEDGREMLLQFMGYSMTKDVSQQKFIVLNGVGGSGKSTLIRLLEALVGSCNTSNISLTDLQQRFASIGLMGKLLNSCADLEISALEDTSIIKKILGEDSLRGEKKGHDAISFKSYAKLVFSTNELPLVKSEKTNGFYRRLLVLPMNKTPESKNPNLFHDLEKELPYLLQLSVQAVERMYKQGTVVSSVNSEQAIMQLWKDSDTTQAFLDECCDINPGVKADRAILYSRYSDYCKDLDRQELTRNNFFKSLRTKGFVERKTGGLRYFMGLTIEKNCPKLEVKTAPNDFIDVKENDLFELPFLE